MKTAAEVILQNNELCVPPKTYIRYLLINWWNYEWKIVFFLINFFLIFIYHLQNIYSLSLLERCWSICLRETSLFYTWLSLSLMSSNAIKPPCLLNNYRCPEVCQISSVFLHHTESPSFYCITNVVLFLFTLFLFLRCFGVAARWNKITTRLPVVREARKQQWGWFHVALSY